jgi:hypothetical protein
MIEILYLRAQQLLADGDPFTAAAFAWAAIREMCERRSDLCTDPDVLHAPLRLVMDAAHALQQTDPHMTRAVWYILPATVRRWPEVAKCPWFEAMRDEVLT